MNHEDIQPEIQSPIHPLSRGDQSRRKFLQTAAAAGVVAATIPIAGITQTQPAAGKPKLKDPLEEVLSRYGSEFGHVSSVK